MSGNYDICINRGFDWNLTLTWNDPDGNPYNLTGYTADMMIRPGYSDQTQLVFATLSTEDDPPEIVLGGEAGTISLSLTAAQTALIPPGAAVYDLRMTSPVPYATKLLEGIAQIQDEVTSS
jgi:hypothetical protein